MAATGKALTGKAFPARIVIALLLLLLGLFHPLTTASGNADGQIVPVLRIEGAIGPATADYIGKAIPEAAARGAPFIIISMDTPGGLDTSMRSIISDIINAPMPVITYVSPSGARAASAGAYILLASHVAAMAPGTNVGAATPVQLGGASPMPAEGSEGAGGADQSAASERPAGERPASERPTSERPASASDAKAVNDAIAYIRSLAEMRGRNADWAEAAVRDAASISAQSALASGVIDVVASDRADLLAQIDGLVVQTATGAVTLSASGVTLEEVNPDWRTRLLSVITDPNIALILMMVGVYGLLFEFMNPGALYPGTIGAIALLVGLYALSALPVSYAGVALILLGLALLVAEGFAPSFGILGIGGIAAFLLGSTIMFDTDLPEFRVALPVMGALAVASAGMTLLVVRLAIRSRKAGVASGREQMIGAVGTVLNWSNDAGHIHVHGERWRASGAAGLVPGQVVEVTAINGLTLDVQAAAQDRADRNLQEN